MNSPTHPHGLLLEHRGGPRIDREVHVVRGSQQVAERADLQAGGPDEREVAGPRLRDRLVQRAGGVVQRLVNAHRLLREPGLQERPEPLVERRLLGPGAVEAPPGLGDQLRRVLERLLSRRVEPQRPIRVRSSCGPPAPQPSSPVERSASALPRRLAPLHGERHRRPSAAQIDAPDPHEFEGLGATLQIAPKIAPAATPIPSRPEITSATLFGWSRRPKNAPKRHHAVDVMIRNAPERGDPV